MESIARQACQVSGALNFLIGELSFSYAEFEKSRLLGKANWEAVIRLYDEAAKAPKSTSSGTINPPTSSIEHRQQPTRLALQEKAGVRWRWFHRGQPRV